MPAVIEATRDLAHRTVRPETPARLRLWLAFVLGTAAALLVATSLLMSRVQDQVRVIGRQAAPQAATAADLYFALSDLDAQVARLVLVGDADALAGTQIDALGTYRERSRQVDADLQRSLTTGTAGTDRAIALGLLDDLAVYRERVWQTLTATGDKHGYYTQATDILHGDAAGEFAPLTDEGAGATVAGARVVGTGGDLRLALDYRARAAGAYPIVLVTYEIVCTFGGPGLVRSFFGYAASPAGQQQAVRLGYAPLPEALRTKVAAEVAAL